VGSQKSRATSAGHLVEDDGPPMAATTNTV